jgi:hypothetical protein
MSNKVKIKSDRRLSKPLRDQVQTLRGMINTGIETDRFTKEYHKERPSVIITDQMTNKTVTVPIFAAREVMEALTKLFE